MKLGHELPFPFLVAWVQLGAPQELLVIWQNLMFSRPVAGQATLPLAQFVHLKGCFDVCQHFPKLVACILQGTANSCLCPPHHVKRECILLHCVLYLCKRTPALATALHPQDIRKHRSPWSAATATAAAAPWSTGLPTATAKEEAFGL